jgi:hypothetical protein
LAYLAQIYVKSIYIRLIHIPFYKNLGKGLRVYRQTTVNGCSDRLSSGGTRHSAHNVFLISCLYSSFTVSDKVYYASVEAELPHRNVVLHLHKTNKSTNTPSLEYTSFPGKFIFCDFVPFIGLDDHFLQIQISF